MKSLYGLMPLPVLYTSRLTLEPWTEQDIDELHAFWTRPQVRRYLWDDEVISRERAADTVRAQVEAAQTEGTGGWLVWRREDVQVGFAGLVRLRADTEPELLYGLAPEWWGRGFAIEAARAVVGYAFDTLGHTCIRASTDAANIDSVRVMERLGMRFTRRGAPNGLDTVFYELSREEFQGRLTARDTAPR